MLRWWWCGVAVVVGMGCGTESSSTEACLDRCVAATTQCVPQGMQYCQRQVDGCLDWGAPTPCPTGQSCEGGGCQLNCTDECVTGVQLCRDGGVTTCVDGAAGCKVLSPTVPCAAGDVCDSGECRGCRYSGECEADHFCSFATTSDLYGSCLPIGGHQFKVGLVDVGLNEPTGRPWDNCTAPNNKPDLVATLTVDGVAVFVSKMRVGAMSATWYGPVDAAVLRPFSVSQLSNVCFRLVDDDDGSSCDEDSQSDQIAAFCFDDPYALIHEGFKQRPLVPVTAGTVRLTFE
jgi:hypothetical protein